MSLAKAGHGAIISIEKVGDPAGTFTEVAELNGDITWPELNRPETEATPHQDTIDSWVMGRLGRGPLTFSVNFIFDDPTHDASTGLQAHIIANTFFGIRIRGPQGSANTDEIIASGHVQAISHVDPVREGVRSAQVTIRLSKRQKIDGDFFGQAA